MTNEEFEYSLLTDEDWQQYFEDISPTSEDFLPLSMNEDRYMDEWLMYCDLKRGVK